MEGKEATLIVPASTANGHRQVWIAKDMTAGELLTQQSLEGYQLSVGTGKPFLAEADRLFDLVEPGGKLYATTRAEQG